MRECNHALPFAYSSHPCQLNACPLHDHTFHITSYSSFLTPQISPPSITPPYFGGTLLILAVRLSLAILSLPIVSPATLPALLPAVLGVPLPINPQRLPRVEPPLIGVSGTPPKLGLRASNSPLKFGLDGVLYNAPREGTRREEAEPMEAAPGRAKPAFSLSASVQESMPARAWRIWKRVGSARSRERNLVRWEVTICLGVVC